MKRAFTFTIGYGSMGNHLVGQLQVGEVVYGVEIPRWGANLEGPGHFDAYDFLARKVLIKARRDKKLPGFARAAVRGMLLVFERHVNERRKLVERIKKLEAKIGANNL